MQKIKQETDAPWKYILSKYFKSFMELCWADRAKEVNWGKKPKFLDKELIKIAKAAAIGNRVVDKLVELQLITGDLCFILIHLEVQLNKHTDFSKRMFIYRTRLQEYYDQPIASMAILLDNDPSWRPCSYSESLWGSEISMRFPIIKLIDYNKQLQVLEQSTNPFAVIILAQLAALKNQKIELRLSSKLQITRKLYVLGLGKKEVIELFKFIDWIISLPKEVEVEYMRNVAKIEKEEFDKNFICPAEQLWLEQGVEQVALNMLTAGMSVKDVVKFTKLPISVVKAIKTEKC